MARRRSTVTLAFTLIEIMVVMVIIALLVAMMIPFMAHSRCEALLTSCENSVRDLAPALENYHTQYGTYPAALDAAFFTTYMGRGLVVCPASGNPYGYQVTADGNGYTIICTGGIHNIGLPNTVSVGFPQYNPAYGLALH